MNKFLPLIITFSIIFCLVLSIILTNKHISYCYIEKENPGISISGAIYPAQYVLKGYIPYSIDITIEKGESLESILAVQKQINCKLGIK